MPEHVLFRSSIVVEVLRFLYALVSDWMLTQRLEELLGIHDIHIDKHFVIEGLPIRR